MFHTGLKWLKKYGSEKIILGVDVRDEKLAVSGWLEQTEINILHKNSTCYITCIARHCIIIQIFHVKNIIRLVEIRMVGQ